MSIAWNMERMNGNAKGITRLNSIEFVQENKELIYLLEFFRSDMFIIDINKQTYK